MNQSAEVAELLNQVAKLKTDLEEQITINSSLSQKVSELTATVEEQNTTILEQAGTIKTLNNTITELETTIKMRDEQLALKQAVIEGLQQDLRDMEAAHAKEVETLNNEISSLKELIDSDFDVSTHSTFWSFKSDVTPTYTTSPKSTHATLYYRQDSEGNRFANIVKNTAGPTSYDEAYDLGEEFRWSALTTITVAHAGKSKKYVIRSTTRSPTIMYVQWNPYGDANYLVRYVNNWNTSTSANRYVAYQFYNKAVKSYYVYYSTLIGDVPKETTPDSSSATEITES